MSGSLVDTPRLPEAVGPVGSGTPDPVCDLFASRSLREHYVRGVLGVVLAVAAVVLAAVASPLFLLLLVGSVLSWRGCISCWTLGLTATRARVGRVEG
ncbi:hypothetical protein [Nocardioides nanhaiensis]|uniref:DUF2892 domain-containing protein n=1 Tax=Nocardioides nanhaiensis TaxID=1476871 RepID=A0ABP8WJB0_9ACTN